MILPISKKIIFILYGIRDSKIVKEIGYEEVSNVFGC
jgi:hypothetical protein